MKTQEMSVEAGKKYTCKINADSNMSITGQIRIKEEKSTVENSKTLSAGSNTFELQFTASNSAQIFFDLGQAPAGLEFKITSFSLEKEEEETTTNSSNIVISDKVNVEGFQISQTKAGFRTVSSVEPEINGQRVVEYGNIYALVKGNVTDKDMYVGNGNDYIATYMATSTGVIGTNFSDSDTAINYVRTMTNNGVTSEALQQRYLVRAYAKLADGSLVYSEVAEYTIFNVAKTLYDNVKMLTVAGHEYIYNNILKIVDTNYKEIEYNWSNGIIKA